MNNISIANYIEALLFANEKPVTIVDMGQCFEKMGIETNSSEIDLALKELEQKCKDEQSIYELVNIAEGFQLYTKSQYHPIISKLQHIRNKKQLSTSALETLAVIAYKQPITKAEINKLRGVDCTYNVQKLLEKELITLQGRDESTGKGLLYVTTPFFMEHFGIKNLKELPLPKELETEQNEIGEKPDVFINNNLN